MTCKVAENAPQVLAPGRYRCATPEAMRALGVVLGGILQPGDVVFLTGDLGAGKTCLTGGVAAGLGDGGHVTSPTFQIMCVHDGGRIPLYHFDLYRLTAADQLEDVGVFEALEGDGACLIEWAEMFADELGDDHLDVRITREPTQATGAEPARVVELSASGVRAEALARGLDEALQAPRP